MVPVALGVAIALLLDAPEIPALLAGGVVGMLGARAWESWTERGRPPPGLVLALVPVWAGDQAERMLGGAVEITLPRLAWVFFKCGAVLYGSGYVLIAFLEGDLVSRLGWLSEQQLVDAVAVGQFTPGPVLTTATFVGYLVAGVPGAVLATVAIFLPAFLLVGVLNPWVPHLRASPWSAAFLDAVNASAVALMAVVTLRLGQSFLDGWIPWTVAALATVLFFRYRVSAVWLVAGGAALGWILTRVV